MEFLAKSKNGGEVFVDTEKSHAATHFKETPQLLDVVQKTVPHLELQGKVVHIEYDTKQVVGNTDLVETDDSDEIVYAKRPNRGEYSRFVKNKTTHPSTWIVMSFVQIAENKYKLHTAFVGKLTPSFPGGDYLPEQSKDFWSNHALVYGSQEIIPESETTDCPW